jgi:histidinol-phosphate aminotransferase
MTAVTDSVLSYVRDLPPYRPGRPIASVARDFGLDPVSIIKLASNENPFGMSCTAKTHLQRPHAEASRYPDSDSHDMRSALAVKLSVDAARILPAAGSSELISLATRAVLSPGRSAVLSQYAFISYAAAIRNVGATAIVVPAQAYGHDLAAMQAALRPETRLVFVASPNNPTGTHSPPLTLDNFLASVPDHVLIILDEAYRDYLCPESQPVIGPLLDRHPNLLILRTFSKVYGLAGLRVGYGLGDPELLGVLRRLQAPFSVSTPAQEATIAALEDTDFVRMSVTANTQEREKMSVDLSEMKVQHLPSQGNFLLLRVGNGESVSRALLRMGIIVRPVANYGLPEWIRVTVGLAAENSRFLAALSAVMQTQSFHPE